MRLPVVLAASLCANAAMIAVVAYHPTIAPPSVRDLFSFRSTSSTPSARSDRTRTAAVEASLRPEPNAWAKLQTGDLRDLVARLRAAGFPIEVIRSVIGAQIDAQFAPRYKEIGAKLWAKDFWKTDAQIGFNTKLFEELNGLYRERGKLQRAILGDDSLASTAEATAGQRRRFGDLPKSKIDALQQIEDDYSDMIGQIRSATQGIVLPEDREKMALLEREKHADLAAVLSPDELADYEMRTSRVTMRLRPALTIMDASDAEFRAIYDVQNGYRDILYPDYQLGTPGASNFEQRRDALASANDQIKAALGDARYADFQRASDRDYQQMYRLAKLGNIPIDQANQAYAVRADTATQSIRIVEDPALSADDKRAALKTLAQNATLQINGLLGQSAGETYTSGARWLSFLQNGSGIVLGPDGSISMRSVRSPRPSPAAAPKG